MQKWSDTRLNLASEVGEDTAISKGWRLLRAWAAVGATA
jgi:hypothetical protein